MKSNRARLIVLFSMLAIAISALAVGHLMAQPSSQATGTIALGGGAAAGTFYSDKTGFNVVSVTVTDADLSPRRVGVARFSGQALGTSVFDLTSAGATRRKSAVL